MLAADAGCYATRTHADRRGRRYAPSLRPVVGPHRTLTTRSHSWIVISRWLLPRRLAQRSASFLSLPALLDFCPHTPNWAAMAQAHGDSTDADPRSSLPSSRSST